MMRSFEKVGGAGQLGLRGEEVGGYAKGPFGMKHFFRGSRPEMARIKAIRRIARGKATILGWSTFVKGSEGIMW